MARCLVCGRRWRGEKPACGHEPTARSSSASSGPGHRGFLPEVAVPGYHIAGVIGRGGFGTVLAASREVDQKPVAIKFVHRHNLGARARLRLEASALQDVGPPHVPELYEIGALADGAPYFVFEHLSWPTLDVMLVEWGAPLAPERFIRIADAILAALEATHDKRVIHRDIKPENIFVNEALPAAKLIDFGIAKVVDHTPSQTTTGMALGTPEYMSPEQCEGRADVDVRSDIYSVGVVLYELLTARTPFFGSATEVREAHIIQRPTPPSRVADIAPMFDAIVLRCLAKNPAKRLASVAGLRRALAEASAHGATDAARTSPRQRKARGASSQRQRMGLLFFETTSTTGKVKQALTSLGGQLISIQGSQCVAVFGLQSSGNPVQRAFDSAQALIGRGLCERAMVDHDRVRVRKRPDGSQRIFSPASMRGDRFPTPDDPRGVLFTTVAADALAGLQTIQVREGVVRQLPAESDTDADATVFQLGAGPLIGRQQPFEQLIASARVAIAERRPTIVTVLSEPGHGKSHLCAAALGELRQLMPTAHVIHLRAREPLGGTSYDTLRALLRASMNLPRKPPDDRGHSLLASRLGPEIGEELWPAAALALGWLDADATHIRKLSAAPAALRSAATRAAGYALRQLASAHPVLLFIDDAHFADETTLDAIEFATLAETEAALWVCVLATPSLESARPAWANRAERRERIWLPPLDLESATELCRRLLRPAENVSQETLLHMVEQTRGSPFLLVELVRGIKSNGLIRRHGRGDAWYLASDELEQMPDLPKVEWQAERELATLPRALVAHARLAAQLGREFTGAEFEGILAELESEGLGEAFPLDAHVGLRRLLSHGLLVTHRNGRFSFRHQMIRDYVAQSMTEELRIQSHQAAYRFYQDATHLPPEQRLSRLAQHAAHCGLHATASAIYLDLADQAARRHSYVDAELRYSRAISMLPDDDDVSRIRAYNGRGLMRYRLSRFEDALDDLDQARAIARRLGDISAVVELMLDEATVLDWMMDYHKCEAMVREARELAGPNRSQLIQARIALGMGRAAYRSRDWETSARILEQAARQAEQLGDPGYETLVIALLILSMDLVILQKRDAAREVFDRVIVLCEEHGDKLHLAGALGNRRALWIVSKDVQRAIDDGQRCRQIGREIGQAELEFGGTYNLAELYFYAGDIASAEPHVDRAVELEPSNIKRPLAQLLRARIHVFAGKLDEAMTLWQKLHDAQQRSRTSGELDALLTESEELLLDMVRLATHRTAAPDWTPLRRRAQELCEPEELAEIIEVAGLTAMRQGDREAAMSLLREALAVFEHTPHLIETRIEQQLDGLRRAT